MVNCKVCNDGNRPILARGMCNRCYCWNRAGGTLDDPPPFVHRKRGGRKPFPIGSRRKNDDGYVLIKVTTEPHARRHGWELEHRIVMEKKIGRALVSGENIHHKNGIKDDNRPENLELWHEIGQQPKGALVKDLIEYVADHHADAVLSAIKDRMEAIWR